MTVALPALNLNHLLDNYCGSPNQYETRVKLKEWRKHYEYANLLCLKPRNDLTLLERDVVKWLYYQFDQRGKSRRRSVDKLLIILKDKNLDFLENLLLFDGWSVDDFEKYLDHSMCIEDIQHFCQLLIDRSWARALPDIPDFALQYEALEEFWLMYYKQAYEVIEHREKKLSNLSVFYDEISSIEFAPLSACLGEIDIPVKMKDQSIFRLVEFQLMSFCGIGLSECITKLSKSLAIESRFGDIDSCLSLFEVIRHLFGKTASALSGNSQSNSILYVDSDWLFRPLMFGIIVGREDYLELFNSDEIKSKLSCSLHRDVGYKINYPFPWLNDHDSIRAFIRIQENHLMKVSHSRSL